MTRSRSFLRYTLWTAASLLILLVVALSVLRMWAPRWQASADRGWAESFESMDALVARYPPRPNNASAVALIALAKPLGISLDRPESSAPEPLVATIRAFTTYVRGQGRKADDETIDPPDEAMTAFLSAHRAELDAIEVHLVAGPPVVWGIDLQDLARPLPPLVGLRSLAGVLVARAFDASLHGDNPAAARSLDAARRLAFTVEDRPELISQLIFLSLNELHNTALRRLPAPALAGSTGPPARDWQTAMTRSLQAETLMFSLSARGTGPIGLDGRDTLFRRLWRLLLIDVGLADYSIQMRRIAQELRAYDPCTLEPDALQKQVESRVPRWNMLARIAVPGLSRAWASAADGAVSDELTRLVVQAKTTSAALPASVPSSVCADVVWRIATQPNGDVQIGVDRNPFTRDNAPPVAFRVHRRAAR